MKGDHDDGWHTNDGLTALELWAEAKNRLQVQFR